MPDDNRVVRVIDGTDESGIYTLIRIAVCSYCHAEVLLDDLDTHEQSCLSRPENRDNTLIARYHESEKAQKSNPQVDSQADPKASQMP
jgi:hypothetical protein